MYVDKIYVRAAAVPYSLNCHRGAKWMYHCALENITDFSCAQN